MAIKTKIYTQGLTFDDVLLMPNYSDVLPREVNISTQLTKDLKLNIPLLSAAMDTVSETNLAIALARSGGISMLHKNMTIEQQAEQVRKVKRSESGMIIDPITLRPEQTIGDAFKIMKEQKIGGFPVIDANHKLVGILTNRDLRFEKNTKLLVKDVMTKDNLITAPAGTDLVKAEKILQNYKIEKLPVVDKNKKLIGLITFRDTQQLKSFPNANKDGFGRLMVGAAIGITPDVLQRVEALIHSNVDIVTLDSAHGHSKGVIDTLKLVKRTFKKLPVIAGNIATAAAAQALVAAGADAIKVGVGPGSICTTRIVTGAGAPQLTAIMEAANAIKKSGVPIIADGGIRYTGDLVKAIAAGASSVMAGSIFAGVDESPGETIIFEGRKFKSYRGMGSLEAMESGSKDRYFQDAEDNIKKLVPEGIVGRVPFKGLVSEVLYQLVGGLQAGMGYCGTKTIEDLQVNGKFVKITTAGVKESHPHDVSVTREAPNYSLKS